MPKTPNRWCVTDKDLDDLTPTKARDLLVKCFFESHKETLARAARKLGILPTDEKLEGRVRASIRAAFREVGGDFDAPTQTDLKKVVSILAAKALSWGTPEDIIEYHKGQIQKILTRLEK